MEEREQPTVGDPYASEVDEAGRNLTQQRIDEEDGGNRPADVEWEDEEPAET
jgi:hypothetical protein